MGPVRRTINFVIALALSVAGIAITCSLLFFANGWKGWMLMGGGAMATAGLCWLWVDFINPDPRAEK